MNESCNLDLCWKNVFFLQRNDKFNKFCFVYFSQTSGMTPLMYAVKDNRTSYLDRLIDLGSDVCARNNVRYLVVWYAETLKISLSMPKLLMTKEHLK